MKHVAARQSRHAALLEHQTDADGSLSNEPNTAFDWNAATDEEIAAALRFVGQALHDLHREGVAYGFLSPAAVRVDASGRFRLARVFPFRPSYPDEFDTTRDVVPRLDSDAYGRMVLTYFPFRDVDCQTTKQPERPGCLPRGLSQSLGGFFEMIVQSILKNKAVAGVFATAIATLITTYLSVGTQTSPTPDPGAANHHYARAEMGPQEGLKESATAENPEVTPAELFQIAWSKYELWEFDKAWEFLKPLLAPAQPKAMRADASGLAALIQLNLVNDSAALSYALEFLSLARELNDTDRIQRAHLYLSHLHLGFYDSQRLDEVDKAWSELLKAREIGPLQESSAYSYWCLYARVRFERGDPAEAAGAMTNALGFAADNVSSRSYGLMGRGLYLFLAGDEAGARRDLGEAARTINLYRLRSPGRMHALASSIVDRCSAAESTEGQSLRVDEDYQIESRSHWRWLDFALGYDCAFDGRFDPGAPQPPPPGSGGGGG